MSSRSSDCWSAEVNAEKWQREKEDEDRVKTNRFEDWSSAHHHQANNQMLETLEDEQEYKDVIVEQKEELRMGLEKQIEELHIKQEQSETLQHEEGVEQQKAFVLEQVEQQRQTHEHRKMEQELVLDNLTQHKLKLKQQAADVHDNLEWERGIIKSLLDSEVAEHIRDDLKKHQIKQDMIDFLKLSHEQQDLEKQRQKRFDLIFDNEAKLVYEKQREIWAEEHRVRAALIKDVFDSIKQQIEEKVQKKKLKQHEIFEEHQVSLKQVADYQRDIRKHHQEEQQCKEALRHDLEEQIEGNKVRKAEEKLCAQQQELERDRKGYERDEIMKFLNSSQLVEDYQPDVSRNTDEQRRNETRRHDIEEQIEENKSREMEEKSWAQEQKLETDCKDYKPSEIIEIQNSLDEEYDRDISRIKEKQRWNEEWKHDVEEQVEGNKARKVEEKMRAQQHFESETDRNEYERREKMKFQNSSQLVEEYQRDFSRDKEERRSNDAWKHDVEEQIENKIRKTEEKLHAQQQINAELEADRKEDECREIIEIQNSLDEEYDRYIGRIKEKQRWNEEWKHDFEEQVEGNKARKAEKKLHAQQQINAELEADRKEDECREIIEIRNSLDEEYDRDIGRIKEKQRWNEEWKHDVQEQVEGNKARKAEEKMRAQQQLQSELKANRKEQGRL